MLILIVFVPMIECGSSLTLLGHWSSAGFSRTVSKKMSRSGTIATFSGIKKDEILLTCNPGSPRPVVLPLLFSLHFECVGKVWVRIVKHTRDFPQNFFSLQLSDVSVQSTMGHTSRRVAPKRSTTAVRSRPGSKKTVSKRRRTPLSVKFVELLASFRCSKPTSLRAFCHQHEIPYEAAHYHLKHSSAASRDDRNAKIVESVHEMSEKTRRKHQSTRISAANVIKKLGKKAGGWASGRSTESFTKRCRSAQNVSESQGNRTPNRHPHR